MFMLPKKMEYPGEIRKKKNIRKESINCDKNNEWNKKWSTKSTKSEVQIVQE